MCPDGKSALPSLNRSQLPWVPSGPFPHRHQSLSHPPCSTLFFFHVFFLKSGWKLWNLADFWCQAQGISGENSGTDTILLCSQQNVNISDTGEEVVPQFFYFPIHGWQHGKTQFTALAKFVSWCNICLLPSYELLSPFTIAYMYYYFRASHLVLDSQLGGSALMNEIWLAITRQYTIMIKSTD